MFLGRTLVSTDDSLLRNAALACTIAGSRPAAAPASHRAKRNNGGHPVHESIRARASIVMRRKDLSAGDSRPRSERNATFSTAAADAIKATTRTKRVIVRMFMSDSWPVCSDRLARLRCFHRSRSTNSARRRRIDTTPGALHEIFSFTAQGRSTHAGSWRCRGRRQSGGARGRSYRNRSAEIAGSALPRLQRLNQAQVRGSQGW